jgi:hypothetical protein
VSGPLASRELSSQAFQAADRVHSGEIQISEGHPCGRHDVQEHLAASAGSGVGGITNPFTVALLTTRL